MIKISYEVEDNFHVATGDKPTQKILCINVEGDGNLADEIIDKFFMQVAVLEWNSRIS